ncbi:hypothetical protein NQ318_011898 [Aromia moschata]|uniref:Uncharacterized protein n=1 Tax=Aromia moschata TaxID=1265417 RepID=A0AAV8YC90_9CUCU|nr:hypothetical protein NQ318_011898 [Aromia moschata]
MSNKLTNVISNLDTFSDISSHSLIVRPILVEEKPKVNKFKCSSSENNIKFTNKGIKQKIVSKVKSWSSRDKYHNAVSETIEVEGDLAESFKNLGINTDSSDEITNSNLMRARDSLENLSKDENAICNNSRCHSCASAPESRERNPPESPKSSPILSDFSKPSTSSQLWDHVEKPSRKNRKDYKRKKKVSNMERPKNEESSMPVEGSSCLRKTDEEKQKSDNVTDTNIMEEEFPYRYRYFPKNSKSVVFTNEVFVVYFNGDEVVCESKEPLKKDVDQQVRNKEMRHGHLLKTQEKYNLCLFLTSL